MDFSLPCSTQDLHILNPTHWTTCCQMFGNCPLLSGDVLTKADLEMSRCGPDIARLAAWTVEFVNQSAFHCIIYRFFKRRHNGSQFPQSEDCSDWYTSFPQIIGISFWTFPSVLYKQLKLFFILVLITVILFIYFVTYDFSYGIIDTFITKLWWVLVF